ncbi:hypothetical protein KI387_006685, partial [Taxus chinensis]
GFIAPEYFIQGLVSNKTDIYSFGILVLEVVSRCRSSVLARVEDERAVSLVER